MACVNRLMQTLKNPRSLSAGFGFTLLETLAALAMVAVVALAVYAALRTGFAAQQRTRAKLGPARVAEQTLTLLAADLAAALPPTGIFAGPLASEDEVGPAGEPADTLTLFVHREPLEWREGDPPAGDICELSYTLEPMPGGEAMQLVRRMRGNLLATRDPQPRRTIIARDIRSLELRFFDGSQWLEVWDATQQGDRLPLAVEVNLRLEPTGKAEQPSASMDEQTEPPVYTRVVRLSAAALPADENIFRR